jgi:CRISPR-associated endonuclease/helicase Cas3
MSYIAHIRESDKKVQTVESHLLEAKDLAESFGEKLGVKHLAGLAGMLHDLGKYSDEFKEYILKAVDNPAAPPKRGSVDHSTAGGKLLYELYHTGRKVNPYKGLAAEVVGNAIISHHSYLQDFLSPDLESNYLKRVQERSRRTPCECVDRSNNSQKAKGQKNWFLNKSPKHAAAQPLHK